jgi:hypothetical protein
VKVDYELLGLILNVYIFTSTYKSIKQESLH